MYDTVNLWLPMEKVDNFDLSRTTSKLSKLTEHNYMNGVNHISGYLGNYKVNISGMGISLKGSLSKYYLPDNFHSMTRSDTVRAFEKMEDELYLPIKHAKIRRIDFSQNLIMDFKPEAYYPLLGDCPYYDRLLQPNSLYYSNGQRQKLFYNKVKEGKAKRLTLPEIWADQNVLRYEMRFINRLSKQFQRQIINPKLLSDEKFYIQISDKWVEEYHKINKLKSINLNLSNMNSPKDFWKQLSLMAINVIGQDNIMQEVENLRNQKVFDKPEYYSRLKKEIRELCKTPELTSTSELLSELDKKIQNTKRYYR